MNEPTRWSLIDAVRREDRDARDEFVRLYGPVVRAYLVSRWHKSPRIGDVDDACQEVLARCLDPTGALQGLESDRAGGLRAYLYGVTRRVASESERARSREQPSNGSDSDASGDDSPSRAFARAWARQVLAEARQRFVARSRGLGEEAVRRVQLLQLRLDEGRPIREIARDWNVAADVLHHDYARARKEYRALLLEVVAEQMPGADPARVKEAALELVEAVRG